MDARDIRNRALAEIEHAKEAKELENIRIKYLGRRGELTEVLSELKDLTIEEKRRVGPELQVLKKDLEESMRRKMGEFKSEEEKSRRFDLTIPPRRIHTGHLNPLTLVDKEIRKIFLGMNFSIVEGPEVETEYYNFDALNIPDEHPAREMWDTFWLKNEGSREKLLMRTHTSPMQIRFMEKNEPPFQIVVPGRVFRYEATDTSHETNFYQLEGLMVGKDINLANFKFVVEEFLSKFFGKKIDFRYRPSYFPFVEPGLEVDIKLKGKWLEIMGAGMVHPRVFEYAHYNPRDWQGFAFGIGIERLAMIKYGIPDVRLFLSGDLRFIKQF